MEIKLKIIVVALITTLFSGCVTQQYENNSKEPLSHTKTNLNEMAMTRISLGLGYLKMGNTSQAKLNLEKAKNHAPKLAQVHSAFAHYYEQVNEPDLANDSYLEALELDEMNADTLNNFGVFLCRQNRMEEAEKYMLKAIAVPSYLLVSQSYENLALCLLQANRFESAEKYLTKSLSHSPNRVSSLLLMAKLEYAKGDYVSAVKYLRNYKESAQTVSANALALMYKTNMYLRRLHIAQNYADSLVKLYPASFEAKEYLFNKLAVIDADELAEKYQAAQEANQSGKTLNTSTTKKTIVLSPKSKAPTVVKKDVAVSTPATLTTSAATIAPVVSATSGVSAVIDAVQTTIPEKINTVETTQAKSEKTVAEVAQETEQAVDEAVDEVEAAADKIDQIESEITVVETPITEKVANNVHVVAAGDNLFSISRTYNIKMTILEKWNNIKRTDVIKIGDQIIVAKPK